MVKLLIEMGADIMATNGYTPTPLMLAAEDGQNEVVKQLLGCKGRTTIDWKDFTGQTALIKAAAGGHKDTVRLLLDNDASIDKRDNNGRTALFYAAVNCSSILRQGRHEVSTTRSTDTESYEAIVQLLVSRGADINWRSETGDTAIENTALQSGPDTISIIAENDSRPEDKGEQRAKRI